MSARPFIVAPLKTGHDRSLFHSGSEPLDQYLREQVTQDMRRRVAACFVVLEENDRIIGYYTLASASVPLTSLPLDIRKKLPRYPAVPAVRMGRFAVDQAFQGKGLGGALLADAINRTMRAEIASYALIVDAKNDESDTFYRHYGFIALPDAPLMLFLPLASVTLPQT
jgi:GNAT superfamily N-acetyltransferase